MIRSLLEARTRFYVLAAAVAPLTVAAGCNTLHGDSAAAEQSALYVDTAAANVAAARARLASVDVDLDRSVLQAPYDAVVIRRQLDEGEIVSAGQPVLALQEIAALQVRIGVAGVVTDIYADGLQPPRHTAHQNSRFSMASDITRYSSVMMLPTRMKSLTW